MDFTDLAREVQTGKFAPIYVLVGEETLISDRALELLKNKLGSGCRFSGREASSKSLMSSLNSYSLFAEKNLVIVSDAQDSPKGLFDDIADYLENPSPNSILVIEAQKLDGRSRFMQTAAKRGVVVECKPLYQNKLPNWISIEAKRFNKQISYDASKFLAEIVGNNLSELLHAVDKLSLYVGERQLIEISDVEKVISEIAMRTVFELTDAVGERNWEKSLRILNNLLANNQQPLMILSMIARHFRILVRAKELEKKHIATSEAASYLGVHHFFVDNYLRQSKNFSSMELRNSFGVLSRADRKLKSSRVPPERIMEFALRELCKKSR